MVSHPDTGINHVARAVSRIDSERARAWTKEDEDYVKDLIRKKAAFSHQKSLSSVFLDLFEIIWRCKTEKTETRTKYRSNTATHWSTGDIDRGDQYGIPKGSPGNLQSITYFFSVLLTMLTMHWLCTKCWDVIQSLRLFKAYDALCWLWLCGGWLLWLVGCCSLLVVVAAASCCLLLFLVGCFLY